MLSLGLVTYLKYNFGTIIEEAINDIHSTLVRHNTEKQTKCKMKVLLYEEKS
jgi:hypothetical protein